MAGTKYTRRVILTGGGLFLQQGEQADNAQKLGGFLHLFTAVLTAEGLDRHQKLSIAVGGRKGGDDLCDPSQQGGIREETGCRSATARISAAAGAAQHTQ